MTDESYPEFLSRRLKEIAGTDKPKDYKYEFIRRKLDEGIKKLESKRRESSMTKEQLEEWCEEYWSNPDLKTPTWEDEKTPYYKPEPYIQNFCDGLTWEELCSICKDEEETNLTAVQKVYKNYIYIESQGNTALKLHKNGDIEVVLTEDWDDYDKNVLVGENRTPDQMLQIIKAFSD